VIGLWFSSRRLISSLNRRGLGTKNDRTFCDGFFFVKKLKFPKGAEACGKKTKEAKITTKK